MDASFWIGFAAGIGTTAVGGFLIRAVYEAGRIAARRERTDNEEIRHRIGIN